MKLYSQRDPKWKLKRLGFGTGTIGNFGCAMTCIAMQWETKPPEVNEWFKNSGCFVNLNLVYWAKVPGFIWRGWSYDNSEVLKAIDKYGSCIIETDFDSNPNNGKHFVLAVGDGKIWDPWDGQEKPFSSYNHFYGYVVYDPKENPFKDVSSSQEPMKNELLEKYGVKDFDELDYKINEHCGTDWGGGRDSGYLGAEREKNKRLEVEKKGLEEEIGRLQADVTNYKTEAEQRKKELREFIEKLAKRLFLPAASDQSDVLGAVDRLLEVEDQLTQAQKALSKKEQEFEKERVKMRAEIDELKSMLEKAHNRITILEQKMDQTEVKKNDFNLFKEFVDAIQRLFNNKKLSKKGQHEIIKRKEK